MRIQDRKDIPRSLSNYQSGHPIRWIFSWKELKGTTTSQSLSSTEKVLWDFWLGTDRAHLFFPWSTKPGISLLIIFVQTYISAKNVTRHIRILEPALFSAGSFASFIFCCFCTQYFLYIYDCISVICIRLEYIRSLQKFKGRYDKTGTVSLTHFLDG